MEEVLTLAWTCWAFRNKVVVGKENPNSEIFIKSLRRLASATIIMPVKSVP